MIDTQALRHEILTDLEERVPDDTPEQVLERMKLVFALFYDVDDDEPDQAIRDALADLMHVAAAQGVDFEQTVGDAARTWSREREDWGMDA